MNKIKQVVRSVHNKIKRDNERETRKQLLEELFNDFNRSRIEIYKMNFFRGISFGLGSVLGGTIVVALIIWILSMLVHVFPPLTNFVNNVTHTVETRGK
jgi:fatty-acid desaturase